MSESTDPNDPRTKQGEDPGPGGDDPKDFEALYKQALAESRKWESRSKANAEKARKFDELEAGKKGAEERLADLEAKYTALETEKARATLVQQVSKATGVSAGIVASLSATDEDGLTSQAKAIAEAYKTKGGAPNVPEAGKFPRGEAPADDAEMRKFVRDIIGNR